MEPGVRRFSRLRAIFMGGSNVIKTSGIVILIVPNSMEFGFSPGFLSMLGLDIPECLNAGTYTGELSPLRTNK